MSSLNKVMIIGRLGKDPDLRYTQNGQPVASMSVATDESYTDKQGNKHDKAEWHRITVWGKTAENCNTYLSKGSLVFVEGSLQTRKWQDQQGQDRYTTEIKAFRVQFLDGKNNASAAGQQQSRPQQNGGPGTGHQPTTDGMDDVPF